MTKKEKLGVDKIVKRVNKEFEKTAGQIETLISDALRQLDSLQNQLQDPLRKLMDDMERIREREMKRFQEEFDRRMGEFHELQQSVLDKLGIPGSRDKKQPAVDKTPTAPTSAAKPTVKPAAKTSAKPKATTNKSKPATAKPATQNATTTKSANTATKAKATPAAKTSKATKPAKSTVTAKTPAAKPAKTANKADLTQIKGIGPATIQKMKEAGITSVDQLANPSAEDQKKLEAFAKMKGYNTWQTQARKLLG